MFTFKKSILTALPLIMAVSLPAMAETVKQNADGTKTVTEIVGYEETIGFTVPKKDNMFAHMDKNGDGIMSWGEFRNASQMDNEYEMFLKMDKNRDKQISLNEYREFDKIQNRVLTESDGDNRVAVDKQSVATQNLPNNDTYTRFVPAKTQNFGSRQEY